MTWTDLAGGAVWETRAKPKAGWRGRSRLTSRSSQTTHSHQKDHNSGWHFPAAWHCRIVECAMPLMAFPTFHLTLVEYEKKIRSHPPPPSSPLEQPVDFHRDRSPSRGATRGALGFPRLVTQEIKCAILFPTPETNCPRYARACHGNTVTNLAGDQVDAAEIIFRSCHDDHGQSSQCHSP